VPADEMASFRTMHHIYNDEEMLRRLRQPPGIASFNALRYFKKLLAEREKELLLQAVAAGWRWWDIGLLLGVSRQAVHQRWQRLTANDEMV